MQVILKDGHFVSTLSAPPAAAAAAAAGVLINGAYPLSATFVIFLEMIRKFVKQLSKGNNREIRRVEEENLIPGWP